MAPGLPLHSSGQLGIRGMSISHLVSPLPVLVNGNMAKMWVTGARGKKQPENPVRIGEPAPEHMRAEIRVLVWGKNHPVAVG